MSGRGREFVERREHLAYAPDHGLYAVFRGAGGVTLAAVMAVIGSVGAFAPLPSFELRPVLCAMVGVGWIVWWVAAWIVYSKAVARLTTVVLTSVGLGAPKTERMLARAGALIIGVMLLMMVITGSATLVDGVEQGLTEGGVVRVLIADRSLNLAVVGLALPVWTVGAVLVALRKRSGLRGGKDVLTIAMIVTLIGFAWIVLSRLGVLDSFWAALLSFASMGIAMALVGWLAAGLRRRVAAILGAIARLEGEEGGRGELARVFSREGAEAEDARIPEKKG